MSTKANHKGFRPCAAEDVVGRIDGGEYCSDCCGVFHPDDLTDGYCAKCAPMNLSVPGFIAGELQSETLDPSSVVLDCSAACPPLGNGTGLIVNRIKNLFNTATTERQFERLIRFIKRKTT